jgi:cytochrome c-type biogenesis protein CcmH/NrfG
MVQQDLRQTSRAKESFREALRQEPGHANAASLLASVPEN